MPSRAVPNGAWRSRLAAYFSRIISQLGHGDRQGRQWVQWWLYVTPDHGGVKLLAQILVQVVPSSMPWFGPGGFWGMRSEHWRPRAGVLELAAAIRPRSCAPCHMVRSPGGHVLRPLSERGEQEHERPNWTTFGLTRG
jgi:hypothetical protein